MATNMEKLTQAGIVGTPHTISDDDQQAIESLSDSEVDTLISVKNKLASPAPSDTQLTASLAPSNTVSF